MLSDPLRKISSEDGRYAPEAFQFVFESLEPAVRLAGRDTLEAKERHVGGQELLVGMRAHAMTVFGPMAAHVWRSWGVKRTLDWGEIVFVLVNAGMLNRQETDSVEDFRDGFDFDEAFVEGYELKLPAEVLARPVSDGDSA
ncbi:MAG: hypothetical protein OSB14_03865 [Planctomycetota bacterium]|jgi:uncharacterized repeat protein (TIGR04138 family)|nr:hypothetical protein [Planctomycetota bacterium]